MSKKNQYDQVSDQIIEFVGGKENVAFLTHCITRLRFTLKDKTLVKEEEFNNLNGVVGAQWSGNQFQIIIGAKVEEVYQIVSDKLGLKTNDIEEEEEKTKKFSLNNFFDMLSGCIAPIIPVMVACGMVKVILLLLNMGGVISADSQTYQILNVIGDTGFYFLPVIIGYTSAKKFGSNVVIGMALGAILIHPTFVALAGAGKPISFLGLPVYAGTYSSSIFPMVLTMVVCAPVERFIGKHVPATLRYVLEPTLTLIIMAPLMLWILAPIGAYLGNYLSIAVIWIYDTFGFIACAILAAIYPLIIMTGMHTAFSPYILNTLATLGTESLVMPTMLVSNFNQGIACLAVGIKAKDAKTKSTAFSSAITALVGGVTEPALYGVTSALKTPLYACMIGGLTGGALIGLLKVCIYTLPGSGTIFGLPAYIGGGSLSNLYMALISVAVGMITTFVATLIMYKPEKSVKEVE